MTCCDYPTAVPDGSKSVPWWDCFRCVPVPPSIRMPREKLPNFAARGQWFAKEHPELIKSINRPGRAGPGGNYMLSLLRR